MENNTKHAVTNPNLYINIGSLALVLLTSIANQDWVKDNPWFLLLVGAVNFTITGALQVLRDMNKPPKQDTNIKSSDA